MQLFEVPTAEMDLAAFFPAMEDKKAELGVNDYSVSQTSLEQVFLRFASKQSQLKKAE